MARHDFDLAWPQSSPLETVLDDGTTVNELVDPDKNLIHVGRHLRLRLVDSNGSWDPNGSYPSSGELLVHRWEPTALISLTGFWACVSEPTEAGDRVLFRLAPDDGAPLYWTGDTWEAATTDEHWNDESAVDEGICVFPFECALTFYVRLESASGSVTPWFQSLVVFWEAAYDLAEDVVRSIHKKLTDEVFVNAEWCDIIQDPTRTLEITDQLFALTEPVEVFNLTNDPCKTTNILASRQDNVLTFVSPQSGEIFVRYRGSLPTVNVAADADFAREELPAVVIRNVSNPRTRLGHPAEDLFYEPLRSKGVVRRRIFPSRFTLNFDLVCTAFDALTCKKLANAVRRAFDSREYVRSLALDETQPVVALEDTTELNRVEEQLFERIVPVSISALEWLPDYSDVPMTTDIQFRLRPLMQQQIGAPE